MIANPIMRGSFMPHFAVAAATDPFWSQTVCICHFDGTDGQTTGFVDSGPQNLTVSGSAGFSYTTANSKFGASSAQSASAKQCVAIGTVASSYISASQDFTIENYFNRIRSANYSEYMDTYLTTNGWRLIIDPNASQVTPLARFFLFPAATNIATAGNSKFQDGAWHHLAVVRSGTGSNNITMYLDGTSVGTCTSNAAVTADIPIRVGSRDNTNPSQLLVDEVRVTVAARYTGSFTPGGPFSQTNWQ